MLALYKAHSGSALFHGTLSNVQGYEHPMGEAWTSTVKEVTEELAEGLMSAMSDESLCALYSVACYQVGAVYRDQPKHEHDLWFVSVVYGDPRFKDVDHESIPLGRSLSEAQAIAVKHLGLRDKALLRKGGCNPAGLEHAYASCPSSIHDIWGHEEAVGLEDLEY